MITAIRMAFSPLGEDERGVEREQEEANRLAHVLHSRHGRLDR